MKKEVGSFLILVLIGVLSRIIPHPWNFTGITAMAIFSGAVFKNNRYLVLSPLVALFISDIIIGFHSTMVFTYLGFALVGLLSLDIFSKAKPNSRVKSMGLYAGMSLAGSFIFFFVSNFGVWFSSNMYEKTFLGLGQCFVAGLPFLGNQILGDLFYTGVMATALGVVNLKFEKKSLS